MNEKPLVRVGPKRRSFWVDCHRVDANDLELLSTNSSFEVVDGDIDYDHEIIFFNDSRSDKKIIKEIEDHIKSCQKAQ